MDEKDVGPELLKKYADGTCSPSERLLVERWLDSGAVEPDHGKVFENLDAQAIERRLWRAVRGATPARTMYRPMAIAVAVVLVLSALSIGLFVLRQDVVTPPTYRLHVWHTDPGQRLTAKLPDGSTVQLRGESTLWYPVPFDARTVVLHGEGLFEVVRDPAHPFSVKTAKGKVEVLGTSFTVRSYRESAETTVSVLRGLVACTAYGSNGSVHLHPGEAVRFSRQTVSDKVHMPTAEMGLWTQDVLHFDHAPLPQVLADVERWFGVRIHAGTGVDQTAGTFRGTFTSPTIQQVLESICFSLNLRYRLDGHDVYLYP